jgi:hypothetical protein
MFLTALLLVSLAIAVCAVGVRVMLGVLGFGALQTLHWLGVAEVPAPPAPRRRSFSADA